VNQLFWCYSPKHWRELFLFKNYKEKAKFRIKFYFEWGR